MRVSKGKRFFTVFIGLIIVLVAVCGNPGVNARASAKLPKHLKILAVGNSLSYDSLYYFYGIANSLGVEDITVGNLYIGNCSLKRHWNNARKNKNAYEYSKNADGKWKVYESVSIKQALKDESWDYVMLSQYSGHAGKPETYKPLKKLIRYIKKHSGKKTKLIWNMMWAYEEDFTGKQFSNYDYDQKTTCEEIESATESVIARNKDISLIIPSGRTIQYLRDTSGRTDLTWDGRHLSKKGRYAVGITLASRVLRVSPAQITYCPKGVSGKMRKEAVNAAIRSKKK